MTTIIGMIIFMIMTTQEIVNRLKALLIRNVSQGGVHFVIYVASGVADSTAFADIISLASELLNTIMPTGEPAMNRWESVAPYLAFLSFGIRFGGLIPLCWCNAFLRTLADISATNDVDD